MTINNKRWNPMQRDGQCRETDNRVQMTIKDGQCRETDNRVQGTNDNKRRTIQRN